MLYNVTKVYVLNNQVLYVDEGEISRDSSNFNQIDVITNVSGFGAEIAFKLPNGVFSNRIGLIQQTGTVTVPSGITELQSVAGQSWSTYTMLIDNAVLSAITSTTSQTLEFAVRFSNQITNLLVFDELGDFPAVGQGDRVYQADDTEQYYIWDGTEYVTRTNQQADALIITEGQVYTTEPGFLSIQGTIGGEPVALNPAFYQTQIVSSFNNLVALYNAINTAITDGATGLPAIAGKVAKAGDTMTGALQFSNAAATRLIMGNNNVTTDAGINATTFKNGDLTSDAVKFSNFVQLFDITVATPGQGETFIDTTAAALAAKFAGILSVADLADFFLPIDGSEPMSGSLNLGGNQITNVGNVDGVDISAFKTSFDTHTHPISDVNDLQSALDTLTGNVAALSGAFIFRGTIANTTAQVEADTTLLDTRIDTLLDREPQTGDVLKDSEGGEWYYDGSEWRFMGQASIDLTQFYTKTEANAEFAEITHTHTESQITDLDKYTQAEANTLLDGKAAVSHTHIIADVTDLQTELDGKEPTFTKNTAFNKDFGNTADTVTEGNDARLSDARTPLAHDHAISEVTGLQAALDTKPTIDDITGKIPASVIPLQFEDVIQGFLDDGVFYEEVGLETAITGEEGKLYIDITTNTLYRFDGSAYVLIIDAAEITSLNDIPDVVITSVANDEALVYNTATSKWENKAIPRTVTALEDTTITSATNGQVLTWNGTAWVNAELPTQDLDDLTDVVITTPIANNLLVHNGTNFINQAGTSSLVGLNNVQNFGIATQGEATTGTADNKYMTPERTANHVDNRIKYFTTTLATGNWSGTAPVTAVKEVLGVLSTDKPLIDIDLSSVAFANVEDKQTEYAKIYRVAATAANEITFFALEAPTEELIIQIKVVR